MSIDTDNSSSEIAKTFHQDCKATNIQLDNLEDDMSEYNDDNELLLMKN